MSLSKFVNVGTSRTDLNTSVQEHEWTIKNWRDWLSSSNSGEGKASLYSNIFKVGDTLWQMKAFPVKLGDSQSYMAFRLVCLNTASDSCLNGTYRFKTISKGWFGRKRTQFKFDPLPLNNLRDWVTYVGHSYPFKDLSICVKIKVTQVEKSTRWRQHYLQEPPTYAKEEEELPTYAEEEESHYGHDKRPNPQ